MKRMFLGTVAAVAIYALVDLMTGPLGQAAYRAFSQEVYVWVLALIWALPGLVGAFCGGLISGRRFFAIALVLWAVPVLYTLQWGYAMQQPARPMGVLEYLGNQLPSLPFGVAAVLLGAWAGGALARQRRQKPNNSSKPTPLRGAA
ncbi:hypothetical protein ACFOED_10180 [Vulcaniibacterium thermophilum]|uniref:hypothetical protein n=1 Tax=Vulcaniibacterium thermophilum TaxID=1169913 RepID=UPI0011B7E66D|nr:hypothetical protein [Vulcaniibacterium thermophilum]